MRLGEEWGLRCGSLSVVGFGICVCVRVVLVIAGGGWTFGVGCWGFEGVLNGEGYVEMEMGWGCVDSV